MDVTFYYRLVDLREITDVSNFDDRLQRVLHVCISFSGLDLFARKLELLAHSLYHSGAPVRQSARHRQNLLPDRKAQLCRK